MKTVSWILALLVVPAIATATPQVSDILYSDGLKLPLRTGWEYPSPLQVYYFKNRLEYPFAARWTSNYRGHVATWKIAAGKLYLTDIEVEHRPPNEANPKSFDSVVRSYKPSEFGVKARSGPPSDDGAVWADWFDGILDCYSASYGWRLYQVQNGSIVDAQIITGTDYDMTRRSAAVSALPQDLQRKYRIRLLNENYIAYYHRLLKEDTIGYQEQTLWLDTDWSRLSPLFGRYDNDHLKWPYNWENLDKCGAPHCQWLIRDDKLYLTGVELYRGLSFDRIDTEVLPLASLFPGEVVDGRVPAHWVSGVYRVKHGRMTQYLGLPDSTYYKVAEFTYVRIQQGAITESFTVPSNFDTKNLPPDTDPGLRKIIEDYRLPPAVKQ